MIPLKMSTAVAISVMSRPSIITESLVTVTWRVSGLLIGGFEVGVGEERDVSTVRNNGKVVIING